MLILVSIVISHCYLNAKISREPIHTSLRGIQSVDTIERSDLQGPFKKESAARFARSRWSCGSV